MDRLGSVKTEKDGSRWILGTNRNGKKKWIKYQDCDSKSVDFEYFIRPEGNIPLYLVKVCNNNQTVQIYEEDREDLLFQYHAHDLWWGTNYKGEKDAVMLIRVTKNRYVFLENGIFEFKTLDKYPITQFFGGDSGISGSFQSYAISASYVYDLHNKTAVSRIEFSENLNWTTINECYTTLKHVSLTMKVIDNYEKRDEISPSAFTCCIM